MPRLPPGVWWVTGGVGRCVTGTGGAAGVVVGVVWRESVEGEGGVGGGGGGGWRKGRWERRGV